MYYIVDCLLIITLLLVFRIHQLNQMNLELQLQQVNLIPSTPKIKQKPRKTIKQEITTEIPIRKQVKIEQQQENLEKEEKQDCDKSQNKDTKEKEDSDSLKAHEEELQSTPPQKIKKEMYQAPLKSNQFSCEPTRRRLFKDEE
ncbi:hypothetical protein pb186bvf_017852 [Paramecium bursaria]